MSEISTLVAGNRHRTRLARTFILAMASANTYQVPAIILDQTDYVSDLRHTCDVHILAYFRSSGAVYRTAQLTAMVEPPAVFSTSMRTGKASFSSSR